jgi:hypothetical protein
MNLTAIASAELTDVIIPGFAKSLVDNEQKIMQHISSLKSSNPGNDGVLASQNEKFRLAAKLPHDMHGLGINMRYLGLLRYHLQQNSSFWKSVVTTEMVARVAHRSLAQLMRRAMSELHMPSGSFPIAFMSFICFAGIDAGDWYHS